MQRVTPGDRDRAVRRLATATGAITATSIALTGAFMALAKHETDAKAKGKAAQLAARQLASTAEQPTAASGSSPEKPVLHGYSASSPVKSSPAKKKPAKKTPAQKTPAQKTPAQKTPIPKQDPPPPPAMSSGS